MTPLEQANEEVLHNRAVARREFYSLLKRHHCIVFVLSRRQGQAKIAERYGIILPVTLLESLQVPGGGVGILTLLLVEVANIHDGHPLCLTSVLGVVRSILERVHRLAVHALGEFKATAIKPGGRMFLVQHQ